jgi:hypothetical protein
MAMFAIEPVTLTIKLTVTKATENGLLGGVTAVEVLSANGETDARFYGFADYRGGMVLNFKADGRPAKAVKADKPTPKALTAAQVAAIPANGTKPTKGKGKAAPVAPAPGAPAAPAPDMAAMFAAFQQFMAGQK